MSTMNFADRPRVDARDKVLGTNMYGADFALPGMLHAMTVPAGINKGKLVAVDVSAARKVAGVVRIFTSEDFAPSNSADHMPPSTITDFVMSRGQMVAFVVAETLEAAIEAVETVEVSYEPIPFVALMNGKDAKREAAEGVRYGDAANAMAGAAVVHEAEYVSPPQHHNPIELLSTTANYVAGELTIWEGSQNTGGLRAFLAASLGLPLDKVIVKSPSIGGGFGQKGDTGRHSAMTARAAIALGRPVKFVMPRPQIFDTASFRPKSVHRIKLGADRNGRMVAMQYGVDQQQSQYGWFPPKDYHDVPVQMYDFGSYEGMSANLRIDTQAPGYMRAPHAQGPSFAFESAIDELAEKLQLDPVALRLQHDLARDPVTGKPLSSRHLNECLSEGARRFGWERRSARPGSMRLPDGTLVGMGVGCGAYPGLAAPSVVTLRIGADGTTRYSASGHEMGQGIRTTIAATLIGKLAIDPAKIEIVIGDTSAAPQHMTAGSWGTASAVSAAAVAADRLNVQMNELLAGREIPGNLHEKLRKIRRPFLSVDATQFAPGQDAKVLDQLRGAGWISAGPAYPDFTTFSYVAHFVEVHVEPTTRRIRVPRVVSIADCGRVISPRTSASQLKGGIIWGISAALREETHVDPKYGGWLNNDLADYVVAVNADIGDIEVGFIDKPDPVFNAMGAKGLGEVVMVGVSAAVANAVYHATGTRIRKLPLLVEDLL